MASKAVPFVASSAFGEKLVAGLQKVLSAAKAPISLEPVDAKFAPAGAKHLLAEPLSRAMVGELANKYALSSKVTKGAATQWYPNTIYPSLSCEVVQNLYALSNPSFGSASPAPSKALATKDESTVKLVELQKESERSINNFFHSEANKSLQATLKLAYDKAIKAKADKKSVVVVNKPHGDVFDEMITHMAKQETDGRADELRSGSVSVEVTPVGTAWPKLVMFPESSNVVVCPSNPAGEQLTSLFVGMAGGTGMATQQLVGDAIVYTCANAADNENPTGALLAACDLLTDLGCEAEAKKILQALAKTYQQQVVPKDLPGGKAEMDAFLDSVAKNCA